ncbi:glycoside hydrolase family 5 protein [Mucilaginibacter sp. RS28]|uniref:Glycoside hydrolase family 5 protein n=1 Tax=Mucilaginibacter straminoryzae TaxID=2932774 RepID=A0A9X1X358_9SPHI|nr:cellulase family glycosylhydrolase [Mucilaginibacter straminoryzae]MCJ8210279.1 glycoside hydrolase family 5 protein [Mucilaginibacter straminoryzae]
MRKLAALAIGFTLAALFATAQPKKFVTVKGKQLYTTDNRPLQIRGVNLGGWLAPEGYMLKMKEVSSARQIEELVNELAGPDDVRTFWNSYLNNFVSQLDIRFIKMAGCNVVRVPFNYRLFTSETYLGANDPNRGFALLDRLIGWCREEKLLVILDMHAAPGGQTGDDIDDSYGYPDLFTSVAARQKAVEIWARIAAHYRNEPAVLGYDLLNEPVAHYFDIASLNTRIEPLYREIVAAIRKTDKNHIVIMQGAQWGSNFRIFGKPFDAKSVYSFHKSWTEADQSVLKDYLDFSNRYNVPLICGEISEGRNEMLQASAKMLDKNEIGYLFWPYKKMESESCMISFARPAGYDELLAYASKKRETMEQLRKAALNRNEAKSLLMALAESCRYPNGKVNKDYISATGIGNNRYKAVTAR